MVAFLILAACVGAVWLKHHLKSVRDEREALKNDMDLARWINQQ